MRTISFLPVSLYWFRWRITWTIVSLFATRMRSTPAIPIIIITPVNMMRRIIRCRCSMWIHVRRRRRMCHLHPWRNTSSQERIRQEVPGFNILHRIPLPAASIKLIVVVIASQCGGSRRFLPLSFLFSDIKYFANNNINVSTLIKI